MAQRTTHKALTRVFKNLSDEDRERVIDYAERLSKGSGGSTGGRESLADGRKGPSYVAAADTDEYDKRAQGDTSSWG